jgi:quercetin dioxygenase-like cupin family protein
VGSWPLLRSVDLGSFATGSEALTLEDVRAPITKCEHARPRTPKRMKKPWPGDARGPRIRAVMKHGILALTLTAAISVAAAWSARMLIAGPNDFKRVELDRHELSVPGREAVMARGELGPDAVVPKHTHPGEELAYILSGEVSLEIEGKPARTLKAGDVFYLAPGQVHSAKNAGSAPAQILSTYIIEKGKPLATPVK